MKPIIHTYTSKEPMLRVNAYIVEAKDEIVIVDTTLTMSDSKALKQKADSLEKPLAGILLTHAHPDHIAGTTNIAPDGDVPIFALASVKKLMEETEQEKHRQWSEMFGEEWIPKWVYPNILVEDGDTVNIAGLTFSVLDIGSGGDCDTNSLWLLEGKKSAAFIGDFIYSENHTYMADGSILRWIANLEKYSGTLKNYDTYYVGHGPSCSYPAIAKQKAYLIDYCSEILNATHGTAVFTEESKKQFEETMLSKYPGYGCQFMIGLAAERVESELVSLSTDE
ncbi:Glyoxylase, beta-lactamase superfamily II [Fodinibius roseus]|uniref:Glyoxylase, beta-lactamase superfamily II n=1 Tax=Fodinibius roseus TaxID=1194090 RepID=A0A1M5ERW8_9BACT|nr:MBL fold metallo-hydrolase [Fodinibius roseus]SHF81870.1 Glyoxylase, beta-lactamase superfamily II [Fodinibius roseus]